MSKKTFKRAELVKKSKPVFECHKQAEFLYATDDGNFFLEKAKNHAVNHARSIGQKNAIVIDREEAFPSKRDANKDGKLSAGERIERIEAVDTLEGLDALTKDETAKTVLDAAEKKRAELEHDPENEDKKQNHKK